jgi:hypothetical protein
MLQHRRAGCGALRDSAGAMTLSRIFGSLLCECRRPLVLARPATAPTTTTERELSLANTMGELDAGNRDGRVLKWPQGKIGVKIGLSRLRRSRA